MFRQAAGFILIVGLYTACKNGEKENEKDKEQKSTEKGMISLFSEAKFPYQLSDTGLRNNADTTSLPATINSFFSDSIKNACFGKNAVVRYSPLAKLSQKEKETFLVVKASTRSKKAGFLVILDKENNFAASYPFLLPDTDPNTSQASSIDKNFTITKTVTLKSGAEVIGEGKEVIAYEPATKSFSLIMMDALEDNPSELVNPIDTFPKTHKLAGDYYVNKKNIISVRDGRYANQLLVYIHTENETGDCIGQMRGEFLVTSATTASFRQGGDPCVLNLFFKGNSVTITEESGCGNYRKPDCPLNGTFTRKKVQSVKQTSDKSKRK